MLYLDTKHCIAVVMTYAYILATLKKLRKYFYDLLQKICFHKSGH